MALDPSDPIAVPVRGGLLPSFEAKTLQDETLLVDGQLGQPIILNFWATWCVPCTAEMHVLERLYRSGVPVIGINVGLEHPDLVAEWIAAQAISFPIVVDDETRTLEALYRIKGIPTTFFVDEDGIIQQVERGVLTEETLANGLLAIRFEDQKDETY